MLFFFYYYFKLYSVFVGFRIGLILDFVMVLFIVCDNCIYFNDDCFGFFLG